MVNNHKTGSLSVVLIWIWYANFYSYYQMP